MIINGSSSIEFFFIFLLACMRVIVRTIYYIHISLVHTYMQIYKTGDGETQTQFT